MRKILALVAALLVTGMIATPAHAATRPVTITASSACVQYQWTVTINVTSSAARVVDLYGSSDYGNRPIMDLNGVEQLQVTLQADIKYEVVTHPGASAQYVEIGVFPAGSGGWDGSRDPFTAKTVRDPIQTNPYATC
jgi:hypothetical protein